jgi:citrate lyase subunit beta / citryl-CoA lyase
MRLVGQRFRSVLFMPASNARALEKARTLGADAYVFDLEDAVAPDAKDAARSAACEAAASGAYGRATLIIRVNAAGTPWHEADMAAVSQVRTLSILLPKVEDGEVIRSASQQARGLPLWAMIETPKALLKLMQIASADPGLAGLVAGPNDLLKGLGAREDAGRTALLFALSQIVCAARAYRLLALDGVHRHIHDGDGFEASCAQGRTLGFDGRTLIHPNQIAAANRHYGPSPDDLVQARAIIAAYEAAEGKGVIRHDGVMIEALHVEMARHILAQVEGPG